MLPEALLWLSLTVFHEARGTPEKPQIAVAQVALNRARENNETVKEVVNKPHQFTWTKDKRKKRSKPWKTDRKVFVACSINAVKATILPDITGGATHYHEAKMRRYPKWTNKMKRTARIGPFVFYKERRTSG